MQEDKGTGDGDPAHVDIPGRLVVFLIGHTTIDLVSIETSGPKALRASPNYPGVTPKVGILRSETRTVDGRVASVVAKTYPPSVVIAECAVDVPHVFGVDLLELKRGLEAACRSVLSGYRCEPTFTEEYTVCCVSGYSVDPEEIVSLHQGAIVALLKDEKIALDEEEIRSTLGYHLKYAKDDLALVDWDGAFLFDPRGDFAENIELLEIANQELLRLRVLDAELDARLEETVGLLRRRGQRLLFRSGEVRRVLREITQIRATTILEAEAIDRDIKLIGDWYSARLYNLISKKLHIDEWRRNIHRNFDTLEDIYTMASENFTVSFNTTLELFSIVGWFLLLVGYFLLFFLEWSKQG